MFVELIFINMFYMNPYPSFPVGCYSFDIIIYNGSGCFGYAHDIDYGIDEVICIYPNFKYNKRRRSNRINVRIVGVEQVETGSNTNPLIHLYYVEVVCDYLLMKFKPIL